MTRSILDQSIPRLAQQLRDGRIRAIDLFAAAEEHHQGSNESNGAYRRWLPDEARKLAARADDRFKSGTDTGPLQGLPVSIKDLYGWSVTDIHAGAPIALPTSWTRAGPIVEKLLAQSAVITGKTHTVEFAFGGLGVNHHLGTPRNPWDAESTRVPGGSSAGAGVSLNASSALLAMGTDTGGSVRIPAAMTANVGLKTTAGRWSLDGIVPLSPTLDTPGPLTRTVEDAIWAFAALDDAVADVPGFIDSCDDFQLGQLRLAIADDALWEDLDPGIGDAVWAAIDELCAAGAARTTIAMPEVGVATELHRAGSIASAELDEFLLNELPACRDTLHPIIASRVRDGGDISAREFLSRKRKLVEIGASADQYFKTTDVVVSPTVAVTPPTLDAIENIDDYRKANFRSLRNTNVANCLGLCALTLPVGLDAEGMPVGLQLMGAANNEAQLLAIGRACEKVLGTARERIGVPPLGA